MGMSFIRVLSAIQRARVRKVSIRRMMPMIIEAAAKSAQALFERAKIIAPAKTPTPRIVFKVFQMRYCVYDETFTLSEILSGRLLYLMRMTYWAKA